MFLKWSEVRDRERTENRKMESLSSRARHLPLFINNTYNTRNPAVMNINDINILLCHYIQIKDKCCTTHQAPNASNSETLVAWDILYFMVFESQYKAFLEF